ncbi:DedA family protein (plasmid) [Deinococcus metallilatus]|uniref:DedA family protein n=1 Tax=Deinococcus metallilatus TaxID=1211322 RepID=A0AAJ5F5U5_9DEIO|nr:DedA family protein [Deinococcus metallilatus]MBB5293188.1 membrane-associated protein [Deinococcus metallilatus]QBY06985.1 DedA family protein [Deinococcus metallilatus]RXJ17996.1 DedA family protein [Deinococcus metallilatus]TLK31932.1 DedA family protein [Deinococcus metallilatus]GMA15586.1 membrane protein [Deinococcus metallilatus]
MFDLTQLLLSASYLGIFAIVFAETGLLLGFFLPGDSLLITAGILAQQGSLHLPGVMLAVALGAIIGNGVGYHIGRRYGPGVFSRQNSRFFRPEYVERTQAFFERYGGLALILARFVPVVRTVAPPMAGVGKMPFARFMVYNVVGGLLWAVSVPLLGYWLGSLIPHLDRYILLVVGIVLVLSLVPVGLELRKASRRQSGQ